MSWVPDKAYTSICVIWVFYDLFLSDGILLRLYLPRPFVTVIFRDTVLATFLPIHKLKPNLIKIPSILSPLHVADKDRGPAGMIIAIVGIGILVISIIGGMLLAGRNATGSQRQTKILRFALYFWVFAFVQLIVVALGYALLAS
jgi:hypothetical protein